MADRNMPDGSFVNGSFINESFVNRSFVTVKIRTSEAYDGLALPEYQSVAAAGLDLLACIDTDIVLRPFERKLVPTGIFLEMPDNCQAEVRPRSGLALKHGITVLNTPGTIDADYRGEIGVVLINLGDEPFVISRGMRIAQLVFMPYLRAVWQPVVSSAELGESGRGSGGFGHSGV